MSETNHTKLPPKAWEGVVIFGLFIDFSLCESPELVLIPSLGTRSSVFLFMFLTRTQSYARELRSSSTSPPPFSPLLLLTPFFSLLLPSPIYSLYANPFLHFLRSCVTSPPQSSLAIESTAPDDWTSREWELAVHKGDSPKRRLYATPKGLPHNGVALRFPQ